MSRNTVARLLGLDEPPRYARAGRGSQLDAFADAIAAMLDADPMVPATVIREHLRPLGYGGGITILKDHLAKGRPGFLAARAFQHTTYRPGEIGQVESRSLPTPRANPAAPIPPSARRPRDPTRVEATSWSLLLAEAAAGHSRR